MPRVSVPDLNLRTSGTNTLHTFLDVISRDSLIQQEAGARFTLWIILGRFCGMKNVGDKFDGVRTNYEAPGVWRLWPLNSLNFYNSSQSEIVSSVCTIFTMEELDYKTAHAQRGREVQVWKVWRFRFIQKYMFLLLLLYNFLEHVSLNFSEIFLLVLFHFKDVLLLLLYCDFFFIF